MRTRFYIDIELDAAAVEREGKRCGFPTIDRTRAAILADIENRLHDSVRFRDGVAHVGIAMAIEKTFSA